MTYPRSVTFSRSFSSDVKILTLVMPGLISVAPITSSPDVKGFEELYDSLAQRLDNEEARRHFQAAVGAAAEDIKARPGETTVPERLEILVKHLRHRFDEVGLSSLLEEALEASSSYESWLSVLTGWARGGLYQALQLGTEAASGAHYLLPFISLLGTVGALPDASKSDEGADGVIDEVTGNAIVEETGSFIRSLNAWLTKYTWPLIGLAAVVDIAAFYVSLRLRRAQRENALEAAALHRRLVDPRDVEASRVEGAGETLHSGGLPAVMDECQTPVKTKKSLRRRLTHKDPPHNPGTR